MKIIHYKLRQYDTRCTMYTCISTDLRSKLHRTILREGTDILHDNIHSFIEIQILSDEFDRSIKNA